MKKRIFIMLGGVFLLVVALAFGKYLRIMQAIAASPKPAPPTVSAVAVQAFEWQPHFSAVGTLIPVRGVDVTNEIAGLVRNVAFASGQEVKAGALLVELNADADIARLHTLEAAADLAATVLARDRLQFAVQAVSKAQIDSDEADLRAKRAGVAEQAAIIAKKTIRAPFSGKLGITAVNPGQYLNPGDKIVTLQTLDPIHVDFSLPQQQISGLSVGQSITLSNDAYVGMSFPGKISAINPKIDAATRTVQVEATLANAGRRLLPGMFAKVTVDAGAKVRYLTLPQTAITYNPYGATVFLLKPGAKDKEGKQPLLARQSFVTTGATRGDQVAILAGLKAGDQVVTSGQLKLKNGTEVRVDNTVKPADNPAPTPQEQ
ncbi:MAG: efflux RND transporter periplasmic adaptor subunit [Sulfuricella sp.]